MISAAWNWFWEKHDQTKDLFRFFVKPSEAKEKQSAKAATDQSEHNNNGGNNGQRSYTTVQLIGLILGPLLFFIIYFFFSPEGLSSEGLGILASTVWMAAWWVTEAIPIPATALLPVILFPLSGGLDMAGTTSSYASDTIFLFLGGFVIALAMQRWDLHKRIALGIISVIGTNTNRLILGFMVATAFLSMWISNTATAMMMVPIGLAITSQVSSSLSEQNRTETSAFGKSLMLAIAYSASIGGLSTLIGSPPNAILAGTFQDIFGIEISFAAWMSFGVPLAWIFIFLAWFYLIKFAFPIKEKEIPGGKRIINEEKANLGPASYEEKAVGIIFVLAALAWILRTFVLQKINPNIDDATIAIIAALLLFLVPSKSVKGDHLMNWNSAVKLPWGILLLFGGGLAIAEGFTTSGLSEWIGNQLNVLQGINLIVVILCVTLLVIFMTEISSNTATATMMYPIMAALAMALDVHPFALMAAAGLAATSAFMMPVATPPNAVVFGSGYLRIPDMAKAGFFLNLIATALIVLTVYFLIPIVLGIDIHSFPENLM